MDRPPTALVLFLDGAGILFLIVGGAGVYAGLALADRIHALLPPITADAAAIGGAALALGVACILTGVLHVGLAFAIRRSSAEPLLVFAIAVCGLMAALALGWALAALVSAASGSAPPAAVLPAGIGLLLVAAAYSRSAVVMLGRRRPPRSPN